MAEQDPFSGSEKAVCDYCKGGISIGERRVRVYFEMALSSFEARHFLKRSCIRAACVEKLLADFKRVCDEEKVADAG